jgi:hypothetical protein
VLGKEVKVGKLVALVLKVLGQDVEIDKLFSFATLSLPH